MDIRDLKGVALKKLLGAKSCNYRWHNKNNTGGNFGINICGLNSRNYEITGYYDKNGSITALRFATIFGGGGTIITAKNILDLADLIKALAW